MRAHACFAVHALPKSVNETMRAHFTVRTRERDQWTLLVREAMRAHNVQPIEGPYRLHIRFYVPSRKRWDASNHTKNLLDALVRAGLIEDDGAPLNVDESYAVRLDPKHPRTEITVTAADAPAWPAAPKRRKSA